MAFIRHSNSEEETMQIGAELCQILDLSRPICLALSGDLGAGKSAFCRGFVREYMNDAAYEVPSPTFGFVHEYHAASAQRKLYHFDLYRLEDADDILDIGWDDACGGGVCLVEWPEQAGAYLPRSVKWLRIKIDGDNNKRVIESDDL